MIEQSLAGLWQLRQVGGDTPWPADASLPAHVPGGVHLDLMAAGRIPDPFVADNELRVRWVAEGDWEYRRTFTPDPALLRERRRFLVAEGLDTLAEVRLNGRLLGETENMFRAYRWDLGDALLPGENELSIVFCSAVRYGAEHHARRALMSSNDQLPGAPYLRKAPCHFGWDWGPKLPNIGIWRPIRLEGASTALLADVHVRQRHHGASVELTADVKLERWESAELAATLRLEHPDGRKQSAEARIGAASGEVRLAIDVDDPRLWWPNGYGEQPLYRAEVALALAGSAEPLDRRTYQIGLRTIELRQEPDVFGRSFTFVVNGVPIFAKGANWVPADAFPTRVTEERLAALLGAAAQANHNMVRAWGGAYYESEAFFDLCDRLGLLVWQDFMFACSAYPHDEPFVENVRLEVEQQVRRLRHRACLALWCGNNEMEAGWQDWGWSRSDTEDLKAAYLHFFSAALPTWVAADDPDRPYWPSSPSSGAPLVEPIGESAGDVHEWVVWHELAPFSRYGERTYRFVSEFGFESFPAAATIEHFAPDPADRAVGSPVLDLHQRGRFGDPRILYYLAQQFRLPNRFESLVYVSQLLQAEAVRVGVEHWRRERARCSGTLYWQLDDTWPASSWSSIDYFGRWKALHYASRRFYAPLLLSAVVDPVVAPGAAARLFVTNDLPAPWRGELRWSLETVQGERLLEGGGALEAPGLATIPTAVVDIATALAAGPRRTVLVAETWEGATLASRRVDTLVPDKHLDLRDPAIEWEIVAAGAPGGAEGGDGATAGLVRLRSAALARWVELSLDGADAVFSDNYFDLPAGREAAVRFPLPEGWDLARARDALRVRSLVDTYRQRVNRTAPGV